MYTVTRIDTAKSKTYATFEEACAIAKVFAKQRIRAIVKRA